MKKLDFIQEFAKRFVEENKNIKECISQNLEEVIEMISYKDFESLNSIKDLSDEEFLKISSMVCAVIYLKTNMTDTEERAYKLIKETGKKFDDNFTTLIKESASRLQGVMFYQSK